MVLKGDDMWKIGRNDIAETLARKDEELEKKKQLVKRTLKKRQAL